MDVAKTIESWDKKPKELVTLLSEEAKKDEKVVAQLAERMKAGKVAEKGICVEALEFATTGAPDIVGPILETIVELIAHEAPKVKWEASRVVANVASTFPKEVEKAIPHLLENTKHKGTFVRWSAALALGEIAKSSKSSRKALVPKMKDLAKKEKNGGVRNVYLKALKKLGE